MDDYSIQSLSESKNEWCARLVNILTPLITTGFRSIFDEAWKLCEENEEEDKYLMTFQNFLSRVPKWNPSIIETERKRIVENSLCGYLEELITCVHVIQLKALTCVRVGQKLKKIEEDLKSKSYEKLNSSLSKSKLIDNLIREAKESIAEEDYKEAESKLLDALKIDPHNQEVYKI